MTKIHALAIAVILAAAAGFGLVAASRTARLQAASTSRPSMSALAARARRLDRVEASLRRALRDRPPALPALPATRQPVLASAPHVVYRRPAPIVLLKQASHGDAEHEAGEAGETDD